MNDWYVCVALINLVVFVFLWSSFRRFIVATAVHLFHAQNSWEESGQGFDWEVANDGRRKVLPERAYDAEVERRHEWRNLRFYGRWAIIVVPTTLLLDAYDKLPGVPWWSCVLPLFLPAILWRTRP